MNHRLPSLALLTSLTLLLGCKTLGPALLNTASGLAGVAAEWAVLKYPDKRAKFDAAQKAITLWLDTGKYSGAPLDVNKLIELLDSLGLDQAGWGDQGQLYLNAGLFVWNLVAPANYAITSQSAVQQVGTSIRDGFVRGLAKITPAQEALAKSWPIKPRARPIPERNGPTYIL